MSILDQIRPCDMDRPYVFISYSSPDKELVWQDVLTFQNMGYNVWLDERNLDKTKASWKDDALFTSAAQKGLSSAHNNLCRYFPD